MDVSSTVLRTLFELTIASMRDRRLAARIAVRTMLKLDLSHKEYARWFLSGKLSEGRATARNFLNDFVLFRVARDWPKGAKWFIDSEDLAAADFSLNEETAAELLEMADEGLSDGFRSAEFFLRVAMVWHAGNVVAMPQQLNHALQVRLFQPRSARQGRKRSEGLDRDRIIRNAFEGLRLRGCPVGEAQQLIADEVPMMTQDAVRKVVDRSARSQREQRFWDLIQSRHQSPSGCLWPEDLRTELSRILSGD